ncbi:ATP-binding protein [Rhodopirellula europaea]|uniref:histidine kinase n=1 Tax=Rhodopirellula europaea 6C TaxID=1263867 RepID=M2B6X8_9BACT|nr:ATP-binding protein [Rhodopirellula europaea]EMB17964.1 periplasmic sensor signal transduction histidine kinase [Rhodopirellula europaea 6C]
MTRLFIQFYCGVLLILISAWIIQAYVFRGTTEAQNISVIETALSGGALLARDEIAAGGLQKLDETVANVQARFDYPVTVVDRSQRKLSDTVLQRLDDGEAVLSGDNIEVALTGTSLLVELGPLPRFAGPRRSDILLGLGSVFLLVAIAIAILMRPIASQLRSVERTALAIADGDFSARIKDTRRRRSFPIVDAFNTMAERVESLLSSQKELLQAVSHEFRTPLARIKFATELVRSADSDEKRNQRVDSIDEATDKLDDLVAELLNYTRTDEQSQIAPRERVSAHKIAMEAISQHAPLHPDIKFDEPKDSNDIDLVTYEAGLVRALGNLIGNAGKYAESKVRVSIENESNRVRFLVEDDGPGIPEADRKSVFDPFHRLSGDSQPGTGLGLALVRRICRRLGGRVTIDDSPLGGAAFLIDLPQSLLPMAGKSSQN